MRLFVAFDLRPEVRESLKEAVATLQPICKAARFVRPEGMHITLKFIGHVNDDPQTLQQIQSALSTVRSGSPVSMKFHGVGFFPNARYPRVIWCGVEASENLAPLAAGISHALQPLDILIEDRDFVPHLTLARFKPVRAPDKSMNELVAAIEDLKGQNFGSASESQFHIFQSELKPSGAEYTKLASYPFVGENKAS